MSNKNKKKLAVPNRTTPPLSQSKPVIETEADRRQDRRITWTQIGAIVSIVVSLASAVFAYRSAQSSEAANKLAQAAQDRATGKIQGTI